MHAVTLDGFGDVGVMRWTEVPDPRPTAGEVVIDVRATAVNRADLLQRRGLYPPPTGDSPYLGLECSGVISELGPGVHSVEVGDQVCALLAGGGYAQRVAVPVGQVMPRPYGLDGTTSASLPEVACTAWSNLINVADLSRDEFVLIHGGAGGVGSHAIQLAKALGARVATTAGSPEKLALCQKLGADVVINYRDQDFVGVINSATGGRGANVVLDNMGAKYLARNVDVLAVGGRLVIIGMQGGIKGELNIATLLSKLGTVSATSLRSRPIDDKTDICQAVHEVVWPMIESGRVKPIIDSVMPITEVVAAHERLESGDHTGKIVLTLP